MNHSSKTQLTLTIIVLILTATGLLYGWIYVSSIQNKLQSLVLSPLISDKDSVATLRQSNADLFSKINALQQELDKLRELALHSSNAANVAPAHEAEIEIDHPGKKEVFVDAKCFEDPDNLNECAVLANLSFGKGYSLILKPASSINNDLNELSFEFTDNGNKFLELKTTTTKLFNTNAPIASVVFINRNDITLQTTVGINETNAIYHYDGQGWIDLTSY